MNKMTKRQEFLTEKQREYLNGQHEPPTDNAKYQMEYRIRENTRKALEDLGLVSKGLSHDQLWNILWQKIPTEKKTNPKSARSNRYQPSGYMFNLTKMITSMFYQGLPNQPSGIEPGSQINEQINENFEFFLSRGIRNALNDQGYTAEVRTDINIYNMREAREEAPGVLEELVMEKEDIEKAKEELDPEE